MQTLTLENLGSGNPGWEPLVYGKQCGVKFCCTLCCLPSGLWFMYCIGGTIKYFKKGKMLV